jgi:hypothetical protein
MTFNFESGIPGWQDIEGLQDVSGTATYRTTFESPLVKAGQQSRVVLEFNPVPDAHEWFLNGIRVPGYDRLSGILDITSHLKDGENSKTFVRFLGLRLIITGILSPVLEIKIGTTLSNRMKQVYPEMFKDRPIQRHGVSG